MTLTIRSLLLLVAVILFVVAAIGVRTGEVSLAWLGMACFAGSFLAPDRVLSNRP